MIINKSSLLVLPFLVCAAWADQVTLKNGDRVTGKIVKKDGAALTFKSDAFGDVTIPWAKVAQLVSDDPLTVVLPDGKAVLGKVGTTENKLEVATQATKESVAITEVGAIRNADEQKMYERLQHPGVLSLWAGICRPGCEPGTRERRHEHCHDGYERNTRDADRQDQCLFQPDLLDRQSG